MNDTAETRDDVRNRIIADPDVILDDPDVMRALIGANDRIIGDNVIDLRGVAMERLEDRLDRLEDTHRTVIAAAYENVSGTQQIHRAVLRLLETESLDAFLTVLKGEVAELLRLEGIAVVLETPEDAGRIELGALEELLLLAPPGFVAHYLTRGRSGAARDVTLRGLGRGEGALYGDLHGTRIGSEACLRFELGKGRACGLLGLGSADPHQFAPNQGTDLLDFFGGVVVRCLQRWVV